MTAYGSSARLAVAATAILLTLAFCCGCPPTPPSQEEQGQVIPSRWICIECAAAATERESNSALELRDAEAIRATVPTVATLVNERLGVGTAIRTGAGVRVRLSGTEANYFRLLADATDAKAIRGRLLTEADVRTTAAVVVIDSHVAEQLFPSDSAVGQTIKVGSQDLTVVGVLSYSRRSYMGDVKRDAFIPFGVFDGDRLQLAECSAAELDRIWVEVETLDQVPATQEIIRNLLEQRHPDTECVVR